MASVGQWPSVSLRKALASWSTTWRPALMLPARRSPPRAATHFAESLELCRKQGIKWHAAFALDGLAEVEMRRGNARPASVLFAAADELLRALHDRRGTDDQAKHQRMLEALAATLGEPAFQQAYAGGRAMTRDEAIACALGDII